MKWTTFNHARDTDAVTHDGSRGEWCDFVLQTHGTGKDGLAISAAVFNPAKRKRANVEEVWALMFDLDGHELPDLSDAPQHVAYTTWSHGTEKGDCWRVLFPLAEPVSAQDYDALWVWANDTYLDGLADEGAKDPSRLMYLPREGAPGGAPQFIRSNAGVLSSGNLQPVLEAARRKRELQRERAAEYRRQMELKTDEERFGWVPDALDAIDPNLPHDEWIQVGMALADAQADGLSDAEQLWHSWSAGGSEYNERMASDKWRSFGPGERSLGTLDHIARQYGWERPRREYVQPDYEAMLNRWNDERNKLVERGTDGGHADTDASLEVDSAEREDSEGFDYSPVVLTSTSDLGISDLALRALGYQDGRLAWTGNTWVQYKPSKGIFVERPNLVYQYVARALHGLPVLPPPDKEDADPKPWTTTHPLRQRIEVTATIMTAEAGKGFFDDARPGLAFRNGFVDGRTGELYPHSQHNRARVQIPVRYDETATAPLWEKTLKTYFPQSVETRNLIEEFFGVCMLGQATKFGKSLFMLGEGSNGKSTLVGVVQSIFPPDSCCSVSPHKMSAHNSEYWLMRLKGKLLNTVTDLSKRDLLDMGDFKAIVTGDEISGRAPHGMPEEFRPVAGHVILTNELPYVADASHGFWRRPVAVKFEKLFTEQEGDNDLPEKLLEERAGIAVRLIRAGMRAIERGHYIIPDDSRSVLNEWKEESQPVLLFLQEYTSEIAGKADHANRVRSMELYKLYKAWAEDTGRGRMNATNFGKAMGRYAEKKKINGSMMYDVGKFIKDEDDFPY